jgi:hypothetical protein
MREGAKWLDRHKTKLNYTAESADSHPAAKFDGDFCTRLDNEHRLARISGCGDV